MTDTQTPALTPENDVILQVKELQVEYRTDDATIYAVNGVDLTVRRNMTVGLVGETGAGKTTTALSIMNLIPDQVGVITGGAIELEGKDVLSMDDSEMNAIRGKDVAMIFQDPMTALNPVFTVGDQIAETLMIHEHLDKKEALEKAGRMLKTVGIPAERAKEYPSQFSGGMKQRVVIAIGLACNPKLLIADEPTTALDVTIQAQVLEIMQNLKETYKMGLIMITHDLGIVAEICDEVAVMYAGRIVEYGTLEDVFEHTLHPYTEGLFNSLPNINDRRHQLTPIPGLMPDPSKLPEGCAFAPRCRYATDACRAKQSQKRWVSSTHYVACSAYDDPAFHIERKEG